MTADEFETAYATRSGITVDELRALGRVVRPCHCASDICDGWQSISRAEAAEYDARYGKEQPLSDAPIFQRGQFVTVTFGGHKTRAMVTMASANGRALMLMFDGMLGGYVGMMPVIRDESDVYRDLITDAPLDIVIEPAN